MDPALIRAIGCLLILIAGLWLALRWATRREVRQHPRQQRSNGERPAPAFRDVTVEFEAPHDEGATNQ